MSGRGGQAGARGQAQRPQAVVAAQVKHLLLGAGGGLVGVGGRAAGAVSHAGLALVAVAPGPCVGGCGRDAETFGRLAAGPSVLDDAPGQAQAPGRGQWRVTVDHEGLLSIGADLSIHTGTRRPSSCSTAVSGVSSVTNLPGHHI